MGAFEVFDLKYPVAAKPERLFVLSNYGFVIFKNKQAFKRHASEEERSAVLIENRKLTKMYCWETNISWKQGFKKACREVGIPIKVTKVY